MRYPSPLSPLPPPCSPLAPAVKARNVVAYRPTETASRKQLMSTVSVEVQALVPRGNIIPPVVLAKGAYHAEEGEERMRRKEEGEEQNEALIGGGLQPVCPLLACHWMENGPLTDRASVCVLRW